MIYRLLQKAAEERAEKCFLADHGGIYSYRNAIQQVRRLAESLQRMGLRRFVICIEDSADLVLLLLAADLAGCEVAVAGSRCTAREVQELADSASLGEIVVREPLVGFMGRQVPYRSLLDGARDAGSAAGQDSAESSVVIFTTGTTGRPKGAIYRWEDLVAQAMVKEDHAESTWLLLYNLNHFAGYQVVTHVICNRASLAIAQSLKAEQVLRAMRQWQVSHASGTPTFWRMFLGQTLDMNRHDLSLRHITIGGETCTEDLLDGLRQAFPQATISQVYATTELGPCFSVSDGRCGFPVSLLEKPDREIQLKIVGNELYVRSPYAMRRYLGDAGWDRGGWNPTGDLVAVQGDRVLFRGRKSEVIKVGGVKVHPIEVEAVVQQVPGVRWVRAYGKNNPVTGRLVVVDVVLEDGVQQEEVEKRIRAGCTRDLARHKRPCVIRFVNDMDLANQKIVRRAEPETTHGC